MSDKIIPGVKYSFSEPNATWLRIMYDERDAINERKAAGTYETPARSGNDFMDRKNASQPPTANQLSYLKKLGATVMPMSKLEASRMISDILATK